LPLRRGSRRPGVPPNPASPGGHSALWWRSSFASPSFVLYPYITIGIKEFQVQSSSAGKIVALHQLSRCMGPIIMKIRQNAQNPPGSPAGFAEQNKKEE